MHCTGSVCCTKCRPKELHVRVIYGVKCQFLGDIWGNHLWRRCRRLHYCLGIFLFLFTACMSPLNNCCVRESDAALLSPVAQCFFLPFVNRDVWCFVCLPSKHSRKVQYSPNGSVGSKPQQCGGAQLWCEGTEVLHFSIKHYRQASGAFPSQLWHTLSSQLLSFLQ